MRQTRNAACDYCGDVSGRCDCDRPGNSRRQPAAGNDAISGKPHLKRAASNSSAGSQQGSKKRRASIVTADSKADSKRPASNSIASRKPDSKRSASAPPNTDFCYSPKDCRVCYERADKIRALRHEGKKLPHRILHMGRSHTGVLGLLRCQMCGRWSRCHACRWNLANRSTRHVCNVRSCRMALSSRKGLKRHKNVTHGKHKQQWCRRCEIPLSDATALRRHFLAKHQRPPEIGETERLAADDPRARPRPVAAFRLRRNEFLRCLFCRRTCGSETEMSDHLAAAHAALGINDGLVRFDRHYSVQRSYFRRLIDQSRDFKRFLELLCDHLTETILSSQPDPPAYDIGRAGLSVRGIHRRLLDRIISRAPVTRVKPIRLRQIVISDEECERLMLIEERRRLKDELVEVRRRKALLTSVHMSNVNREHDAVLSETDADEQSHSGNAASSNDNADLFSDQLDLESNQENEFMEADEDLFADSAEPHDNKPTDFISKPPDSYANSEPSTEDDYSSAGDDSDDNCDSSGDLWDTEQDDLCDSDSSFDFFDDNDDKSVYEATNDATGQHIPSSPQPEPVVKRDSIVAHYLNDGCNDDSEENDVANPEKASKHNDQQVPGPAQAPLHQLCQPPELSASDSTSDGQDGGLRDYTSQESVPRASILMTRTESRDGKVSGKPRKSKRKAFDGDWDMFAEYDGVEYDHDENRESGTAVSYDVVDPVDNLCLPPASLQPSGPFDANGLRDSRDNEDQQTEEASTYRNQNNVNENDSGGSYDSQPEPSTSTSDESAASLLDGVLRCFVKKYSRYGGNNPSVARAMERLQARLSHVASTEELTAFLYHASIELDDIFS